MSKDELDRIMELLCSEQTENQKVALQIAEGLEWCEEDYYHLDSKSRYLFFKNNVLKPFLQCRDITIDGHKLARLETIPHNIEILENLQCLSLISIGISREENIVPLSRLSNIEKLNLKGNQLTGLPKAILELPKLKYLNLSEQTINWYWTFGNIWRNADCLQNLEVLLLDDNGLRTLPNFNRLPALQILSVKNNTVNSNPDSLAHHPALINVNFYNSTDIWLDEIIPVVSTIPNLKTLDLRKIRIKNENKAKIPSDIGNLKNLKELYLSKNRISELPKSIGNLENLEVLDIYRTHINHLPDTILGLKNLKILNWGGKEVKVSKKELDKLQKHLPDLVVNILE